MIASGRRKNPSFALIPMRSEAFVGYGLRATANYDLPPCPRTQSKE